LKPCQLRHERSYQALLHIVSTSGFSVHQQKDKKLPQLLFVVLDEIAIRDALLVPMRFHFSNSFPRSDTA
jgi:hypothetical protein